MKATTTPHPQIRAFCGQLFLSLNECQGTILKIANSVYILFHRDGSCLFVGILFTSLRSLHCGYPIYPHMIKHTEAKPLNCVLCRKLFCFIYTFIDLLGDHLGYELHLLFPRSVPLKYLVRTSGLANIIRTSGLALFRCYINGEAPYNCN